MRLPRVQFKVRWMMILVALATVAAWLLVTADRVRLDPQAEQMSHLRLYRDTAKLVVQTHPIQGVFWPRYWRRLLGQPWPGTFVCPSCRERYERSEKCKLIDLASSDDGQKMINAMGKIERERHAADIEAMLRRAGR
jgi:hypothetical protein